VWDKQNSLPAIGGNFLDGMIQNSTENVNRAQKNTNAAFRRWDKACATVAMPFPR
jgi:hypothetical protein